MKNYVQSSKAIQFVAAAAVVGGQALQIGSMFGIVAADTAQDDTGVLEREGVYKDLPSVSNAAFTKGDKLYWDDTAKKLTKISTSNLAVGHAFEDKASSDAVASLILCPSVS